MESSYVIETSPSKVKPRAGYRPRIVHQPTASLIGASVLHASQDQVYAFGGFDPYTDEVFNTVLRLDLGSRQWSLINNYGDVPGVRMWHTASLWRGEKVIVFGGEDEHERYLNDLTIFDIKTARWHRPQLRGVAPQARARHSATIHDDKLFIVGGIGDGNADPVLGDFCYLDLVRWEWSPTFNFVPRCDHYSWVYSDRIWISGGVSPGGQHVDDIWSVDLRQIPAFGSMEARDSNRTDAHIARALQVSGPHTSFETAVSQRHDCRFQTYSSGRLLNLAISGSEGNEPLKMDLYSLNLDSMQWERLAGGTGDLVSNYRWQYCAANPEGTELWLLGGSAEQTVSTDEECDYLSDVLRVKLANLGTSRNGLRL